MDDYSDSDGDTSSASSEHKGDTDDENDGAAAQTHGPRQRPRRQRPPMSALFDQLTLGEQQRMLQHFLRQQDTTNANLLQDYMIRQLQQQSNRFTSSHRQGTPPLSTTQHRGGANKPKTDDEETDKSRWVRSHQNVRHFKGKWLNRVCLRPLSVSNKLSTMGKQSEISQYLTHFNSLKLNYSAIEITLLNADGDRETYLIYPDFCQLITTHLFPCGPGFRAQISTEIKCNDTEWSDNMYRGNYGKINSVSITDSDDIVFTVTNHDIWRKDVFSDEQFLQKSILPIPILTMVCYEYADTQHDAVRFNICHPCKRTGDSFDYNWICHQLETEDASDARRRKEDCIEYQYAGIMMGKYVNATTAVTAGRYTDAAGGRAVKGYDQISTRISFTKKYAPTSWSSK